jgi:hypothetical protein
MRHTVVIYTDTTSKEAVADFMERQRHRRERERRRQQRRWYFIKQRLLGVFLLLLTAVSVYMLGDATIAFITVPLALLMLFSKEMVITNSFYWETEERRKNTNA